MDPVQPQVPNPRIDLFERDRDVSDRRQVGVLHQKLRRRFPKNSLWSNTEALRILDLVESLRHQVALRTRRQGEEADAKRSCLKSLSALGRAFPRTEQSDRFGPGKKPGRTLVALPISFVPA